MPVTHHKVKVRVFIKFLTNLHCPVGSVRVWRPVIEEMISSRQNWFRVRERVEQCPSIPGMAGGEQGTGQCHSQLCGLC